MNEISIVASAECSNCDGGGWIDTEGHCPFCEGSGRVQIDISIGLLKRLLGLNDAS